MRTFRLVNILTIISLVLTPAVSAGYGTIDQPGQNQPERPVVTYPCHYNAYSQFAPGYGVQLDTTVRIPIATPACPKPSDGWPVFITIHGFGGNKKDQDGAAILYAEQGYVAVNLSWRGHGSSEGTFDFLDQDEQQDLVSIKDWLTTTFTRTMSIVNPNRFGIEGHGLGSFVSWMAAAENLGFRASVPGNQTPYPEDFLAPNGCVNNSMQTFFTKSNVRVNPDATDDLWAGYVDMNSVQKIRDFFQDPTRNWSQDVPNTLSNVFNLSSWTDAYGSAGAAIHAYYANPACDGDAACLRNGGRDTYKRVYLAANGQEDFLDFQDYLGPEYTQLWMQRWLQDVPNGVENGGPITYLTYLPGDPLLPANHTYFDTSTWPPEGVVSTTYYLRSGGQLSYSAPGSEEGADTITNTLLDPTYTITNAVQDENPAFLLTYTKIPTSSVTYLTPPFDRPMGWYGAPSITYYTSSDSGNYNINALFYDVVLDSYGHVVSKYFITRANSCWHLGDPGTRTIVGAPIARQIAAGHQIQVVFENLDPETSRPSYIRQHTRPVFGNFTANIQHSASQPTNLVLPLKPISPGQPIFPSDESKPTLDHWPPVGNGVQSQRNSVPMNTVSSQPSASGQAASAVPGPAKARPGPGFIQNAGQFDSLVRFQMPGSGETVWVTDDAIWLNLEKGTQGTQGTEGTPSLSPGYPVTLSPCHREGVNLRLHFARATPEVQAVGVDRLPAKMNYFVGQDRSRWQADVPTYSSVVWKNLYPGLNVTLLSRLPRGQGPVLQVDASSDQNFARLELEVEGSNRLQVNAAEQVIAETSIGPIPIPPLLTRAGTRLRPRVQGNRVHFEATGQDVSAGSDTTSLATNSAPKAPNTLQYSTFLGGDANDTGYAIWANSDSTVIVAGSTASGNFPTTPGAYQTSGPPPGMATISKLSASGASLVYSTFLGGYEEASSTGITSIAVDSTGAVYATGQTSSSDFPVTPGVYTTTLSGSSDAFVTKLSPNGDSLTYSTFLGGADWEQGLAIAVNTGGEAYVTGHTESYDFPLSANAFGQTCTSLIYERCAAIFVTKLNASGSRLLYSTWLDGADDGLEYPYGIAVDTNGSAYIAGHTNAFDFPTTPGAYQRTAGGEGDGFVTKLTPDGSGLVYSTYIGGTDGDSANGIAIDRLGNAYVAGSTSSSDFPTTPGAYNRGFNGSGMAFVLKLNSEGSDLVYSTFLGGSYYSDTALAIALDASGAAYVVGSTPNRDFPTTPGAFQTFLRAYPRTDGYFTKINPLGTGLLYSTYLGGAVWDDFALAVAIGPDGSAYVTGDTFSADFPVTAGALDSTCANCTAGGNLDAFVTKLNMVPYKLTMLPVFAK